MEPLSWGDVFGGAAAVIAAGAMVVAALARKDSKRSARAAQVSAEAAAEGVRLQARALELAEAEAERYPQELVVFSREPRSGAGYIAWKLRNGTGERAMNVRIVCTDEGVDIRPTRLGDVGPGGERRVEFIPTYDVTEDGEFMLRWERPNGEVFERALNYNG